MTWLDDYKARLDGIVRSKSKAVEVTGSPQLSNAYALLASIKASNGVDYSSASKASGGSDGISFGGAWNATKSGGLKLLDFLSRPNNAVASAAIAANQDNKVHHENLQKAATFLPIVGTYLGELVKGDISNEADAFWEGLKGNNPGNTFSDVARKKGIQGKTAAAVGLGADIAFDPLNLVGAGTFRAGAKGVRAITGVAKTADKKVGRELAEAALEPPSGKATNDLLEQGSARIEKNTGNDLLEFLVRNRQVTEPAEELGKIADPVDTSLFERPKVEAKPADDTGFKFDFENATPKAAPKVADPDEVALLAARAASETAVGKLSSVPLRRYSTSHKIQPAFVEETVAKADTPVVAKTSAAPKAAARKTMDTAKARALAMKQHILSTPNYQLNVTIGGRPTKTSIANLRSIAEKDKSKAKMIDTMINQEAKRLASESPEYFSESPLINLTGRSGSGRAAMSVDDFQRLLETGEVPKPGKGKTQAEAREFFEKDKELLRGESPLDAFGLHSTDDLANLHLSDIAGGREAIGAYLKRQGVKISNVDPVAEGRAVEAPGGPSSKINTESAPSAQNKINSATGTVQGSTEARYRAMTPAERQAWVDAHKDILDPEDIKKLLSTKITKTDVSAWHKSVDEVLNRIQATGFNSVSDLVSAIDKGLVNPADVEDLMKVLGVKTPNQIQRAMKKLMDTTVELEKKTSAKRLQGVDVSKWETPLPAVKEAEEIVTDVVNKGDTAALADVKPTLDVKQVADVKAGLGHLVQREIIDPQTAEKYGFVSRSGTKRTHATVNKGLGRNLDEWNKFSQLSLVSGVIKFRTAEVVDAIKASGLKGPAARNARSKAMYDHVIPVMTTVDRILKESGIPPMLGKNPRYVASLTDVLRAMPEDFVQRHFFSVMRDNQVHIPPTFWNDAAEVAQDYAHGLLDFETAIHGVKDVLLERVKLRSGKTIHTGVRNKYYALNSSKGHDAAEEFVLSIAREFMKSAGPIKQQIEKNIAEVVVHDANGAAKVSEQAMQALTELVASPGFSSHDLMRVASDRNAIIESVAKSAGVTSDRAKALAKSDVEVQTAPLLPPEVVANAHDAKVVAEANKPLVEVTHTPKGRDVVKTQKKKIVNAIEKSLDNTETAVKQVTDDIGESLTDIGANAERVMGWSVLKAFAPHLGNADVRPMFLTRNSFAQTVGRSYSAQLSKIANQHASRDIDAAWKELQNGTRPAVESVAAAHAELEKAVRSIFNDDPNYNTIRSSGITPEQINSHYKKFGIHEKYRVTDDYMNDWKKWETDNPLDLLSRFQAAVMASRTERVLGADLSRRFGSATPTADSVKITGSKTILGKFLDPDAYFPREIAEQMSVLDEALKQMSDPKATSKAVAMYDNVLHAYKSGLTIYRPGHHIRNMVGDTWLSWMDGVNNPSVYRQALKVMADNRGRYDDFDALQALAQAGENNAKKNSVVASTVINGKRTELTTGQVYQLAYKNGILPDYRTLEDIQFGQSSSVFDNLGRLGKPFGGKLHQAASTISESRDHYVRIAHFIDRLNKSNGSSLDDVAEAAANRVRKWHPDGSDLTNFESKVARRTLLFYSWLRKAIPLVVESTVMKPGKTLVYPKAMYALAEANGVDPNSLGDPFPQDELFPSWIRESTEGPSFINDGRFFSVSPGIPFNDVVNDFGVDPKTSLRNVLGSTTPAIKIPFEVAAGSDGAVATDIRSGAPKRDLSDYVDQQIPGVNVVANLSNRSPSSLFTQNTGESTGMTPEQITAANEKNTPGPDTLALLNWLTGAGLMNLSKPNYKKQAEIERGRSGR